jgi:pimeloyl-ACP methyl ester carboxylesterase
MKPLPAKQKLDVNGATLQYIQSGTGSPTIVLVNGSGGPVEGWLKVHGALEELGTVFAYNRPGIGGSSKPAVPQTGDVVVATLRELLNTAGLAPPYLLVGHSLGGLFVNLFARQFPQEVSGVVMLDATAPEDVSVMAAHQSAFQRCIQWALDALLGKNAFGETEHLARTVELIQQSGPFPAVPLIVVTGGKPALSWATPAPALAARAENQRRLAALSPQGRQVMAQRSGHFPQFSEPAVVVNAIREAVSLRAGPKTSGERATMTPSL